MRDNLLRPHYLWLTLLLLYMVHLGREVSASEGGDGGRAVPLPPLQPYAPSPGTLCGEDFHTYITDLTNLTLWAAQMFDSNGKLPTGVLYGATHEFGNFDQCLSVENKGSEEEGYRDGEKMEEGEGGAPPNRKGERRKGGVLHRRTIDIRGKYCLAKIDISTAHLQNASSVSGTSIWHKALNASLDRSALPRTRLHWGVCVPHSCSAEDVQRHLSLAIRPIASYLGIAPAEKTPSDGPTFAVLVSPSMCSTQAESEGLSAGEICMCSIIAAFVASVLLASILELLETNGRDVAERGIFLRTLRCFSSITNVRRLASKADSSEPFAFINGLKVMTMFLIIFGHRFIFNTASPLSNSEFVENLYHRADTQILMGGTVVVDSFLIISGCLLVYLLLQELNKSEKRISILFVYIHRFFRLTPLYMIVVAFYATLFPRIGDGPLWKAKVGEESEYCAENWWTNILYVNTFVNSDRLCMIQSWYMAVDMHLFLIGVPITYLLHNRPALGKALLVAVTICAAAVAFAVTYLQQLDPILLVYFKTLQNLREDPTFRYSYIQSYMRALPYFLGMIIGYLIHEAHRTKFQIPKKLKPLFLVITIVTSLIPILGSMIFLNPKHQYNALAAAVFNPVHRALWACGMGIIIFAEATDCSYPITKILRWNTIVPMSRITYSAFLVHAGVQIYSVNTRRVLETASMYSLFSDLISDTSYTFILAFLFSVVFEAPLLRLEKLILQSVSAKGVENGQEIRLETAPTAAVATEHGQQLRVVTDK